jgi:hypothetical protein
MEITMVMSGDHLLMIEHIISMEYIVIILYRYYYNIGGFTAKRTTINRIPFGFSTTDLNGDGSGFSDAYQGNSDRFPGESRNNDRLPWNATFDLDYNIKLKYQQMAN